MARIVLMPSAYLPDLGGVEEMCHNLALALRQRGDEVEVWTTKVPAVGATTEDRIDGIQVRRFPCVLPALRVGSLLRFPIPSAMTLRSLSHAARLFRPDVINVHCFGPNGVYATVLSSLRHIPLVVTLHGETVTNDHDVFEKSAILRHSLALSLRRASAVTGCSQFALDDAVTRFGLQADRGEVIFNGIQLVNDNASEKTPADHPGSDDDEGRVLTVLSMGRMVHNKGFDLLIEAFARIAPNHPSACLVLAGSGDASESLRAQVGRLDLKSKVTFPGRLDRAEVATALADAAIYALTSRSESFGLVILEAWQARLPVIATSHGGPQEFVTDYVDGLLVDPLDVGALASSLDRLLSDTDLRRRLGTAGRQTVKQFGWTDVANRYAALYDRVLAKSS